MWRLGLLSLILLLITCKAYAQPDDLPELKTYADKYTFAKNLAVELHSKDSATYQKTFDNYIKQAKRIGDEEFVYQLQLAKIVNESSDNKSELLEVLRKISESAKKKGYDFVLAECYFYLGEWYWELDYRTKSIEAALKSYDIYKHAKRSEFPGRVRFQHELATRYFDFKEYARVKEYMLELQNADTGSLYSILGGGYYNTLGLAYQLLGQYDSAIDAYKLIYQNKLHGDNYMVVANVVGNIATTYKTMNKYDSALVWMMHEQDILNEHVDTYKPSIFYATSYTEIAWLYLVKKDLVKANEYIDKAAAIFYNTNEKNYLKLQAFYNVLVQLRRAEGNYKASTFYLDTLMVCKDSVQHKRDKAQLIEAEHKIEIARNELKLANLQHTREVSIWVRNFVIALVCLLSLLALLFINRSRLKHKQKELLLENEKNKAETQLVRFTSRLQEKNLQLLQLKEEIQELTNEQDIQAQNEMITQLQQSTILTDEEWDNFRNLFEQVHGGYINKVKNLYPDITPAELRYITLVKLDMNNKEMSAVLGIGTNTVRNYKFRLRKKFKLSDEDDLDAMIKSI